MAGGLTHRRVIQFGDQSTRQLRQLTSLSLDKFKRVGNGEERHARDCE
jgi:hypothetical protein